MFPWYGVRHSISLNTCTNSDRDTNKREALTNQIQDGVERSYKEVREITWQKTKQLNITVFLTLLASSRLLFSSFSILSRKFMQSNAVTW